MIETMRWIEWLKQLRPELSERRTQMTSKELVTIALEKYNEDKRPEARNILLRMTRRIPVTDENIDQLVSQNLTIADIAAEGWIDLAIDMIDRELGEDSHALVPVGLALRTAISLLK